MFVGVMNTRIADRNGIITAYMDVIRALTGSEALKSESATLQDACDVVLELMRQMVRENTRSVQDQTEYQRRYSALVDGICPAN